MCTYTFLYCFVYSNCADKHLNLEYSTINNTSCFLGAQNFKHEREDRMAYTQNYDDDNGNGNDDENTMKCTINAQVGCYLKKV